MPSSNLGDFAYFVLIYNFLSDKIGSFGDALMGRTMSMVGAYALLLLTLWMMIRGYRIVTGRSRELMMVLVVDSLRNVLIITAATTMAILGTNLYQAFTVDLDKVVNGIVAGNDDQTTAQSIDANLAYTQVALSTIDAVQVAPGDTEMQNAKARTELIAAFGTASPPMVAGALLLLYQFAMALFVGFGPLFILCLLFDQTKDLFKRWLMYGIGTLFAMATLSAVCAIVFDLTVRAAGAYWMSKVVNSILGNSTEGLTNQALQQGGLGLLMTVLIISAPRMAANFFQGTLGEFMFQSAFGFGASGARMGAGAQLMPGAASAPPYNRDQQKQGHVMNNVFSSVTGVSASGNTPRDEVKPYTPNRGG